jgi:2-keto-4-pentenoate hydratase/2-oxohepta-3-ene-1,7-dioic acid hydratase in catechol pathway
MRFVTTIESGRTAIALVLEGRVLLLALPDAGFGSMREIAASGPAGLERVAGWARQQPDRAWRSIEDVVLGPAVPDPGAIYTIGRNYVEPGAAEDDPAFERPLVYAKLPAAVTGHGSVVTWDRSLTGNVDPECELGVVIGEPADTVGPADAMRHVFGYTCINDISSRDPWLDGDQWLLGKSMAGFCPVGPWVVTADELVLDDLRLGCTINGIPIQASTTAGMRFPIAEVISYLSRHATLQPGDLIATGTPARLAGPLGPERHLQPGDLVSVWIEGIGELSTTIA